MKRTIIITLVAIGTISGIQALGNVKAKTITTDNCEIITGGEKTVTLKITGMTCGGCASHVSTALGKVDGVINENVSYPGNKNTITYDPEKTSVDDIIAAIEKTGYKAKVIKAVNKNKS